MKRILLIALVLMALVGTVSAYQLYLVCPENVQAGLPLKCTIESNFPAGTTFNFAIYQSGYTATQIRKQPVTIQKNQNTQYIVIDTQGLPGGSYKAEIQTINDDDERFSSDSKILRLITIIDRSGDIEITSPVTQDLKDALRIEGESKNGGNDGIEIEVNGPDGRVFGPQWIGTKASIKNNAGVFTTKVPVSSGGDYSVEFSDSTGFIGSKTFTVVAPTTPPTTIATTLPTYTKTIRTTVTTPPTPVPTTEQSPQSPLLVVAGLIGAGMLAVLMTRRLH
jgi:hypothetical protein